MSAIRKRVSEILEPGGSRDKLSKRVDLFLILLVTLNVLDVIIESVREIHDKYHEPLLWFEFFSIFVFSVEYLLRVWSCVDVNKDDPRPHWRQRLAYFFTPMALIDLVAILPFYLSLFITLDLRFLRVLRILRIFKLTRYSKAMQLIFNIFQEERNSFVAAFSILFTLLIIAASGIYLIEHNVQPDEFGSIPEAMWWAMATLTTVGYGDVTPITAGGKVFGGMITIISMGMVALPAGILAGGFNSQMHRRHQKFNVLLKEVLRDGVISDQEWQDIEVLRKELDLDIEEANLLIQLSEARRQNLTQCPNCGCALHTGRRESDPK